MIPATNEIVFSVEEASFPAWIQLLFQLYCDFSLNPFRLYYINCFTKMEINPPTISEIIIFIACMSKHCSKSACPWSRKVERALNLQDLSKPMIMRHSSSVVTVFKNDIQQSAVQWGDGGKSSVACRMLKILVVCNVKKSSVVKASAPEVHSGWTPQLPRRMFNVDRMVWFMTSTRTGHGSGGCMRTGEMVSSMRTSIQKIKLELTHVILPPSHAKKACVFLLEFRLWTEWKNLEMFL